MEDLTSHGAPRLKEVDRVDEVEVDEVLGQGEDEEFGHFF